MHWAEYVGYFMLVMAGIITLGFTGWILHEHLAARDFIETQCHLTGVIDHGQRECMYRYFVGDETQTAYSSIHCVQLVVTYKDMYARTHNNATVFDTATMIQNITQPCSYWACSSSEDLTNGEVTKFVTSWTESPSEAQCYYDPSDYSHTISQKMFSRAEAIHAVFWPIFVCVLTLIVVAVRCYFSRRSG